MKKLWDNSSILYKAIAVVLTLIMVVTPLYIHFDKRYDAKAAEGDVEVVMAYLPDSTVDDSDKMIGRTNGWQIIDSTKAVGKDTNRRYAYLIKVKNGLEYESDGEPKYSTDGITFDKDLPNTSFDDGDYKVYVVNILDTETTLKCAVQYTISGGSKATTGIVGPFSFQDNDNTMSAIINGDVSKTFTGALVFKKNDTITVTIETTGTLNALSILGGTVTDINPETNTDITYEKDAQTLISTYTYTYTFTGENKLNEDYTEKKISATTSISDSFPIADLICTGIIYDATNPEFIITKVGSDNYDPAKEWYSDVTTAEITITSGNDTKESNLVSASVNSEDVTVTDTLVTKEVTLNEGVNSFEVTAADVAGNTDTKTLVIKVDNTAPVVDTLTVGGDDTNAKLIGLNSENDVVIAGTTSDLYVNNEAGSGVKQVNIIVTNTADNSVVGSNSFDVNSDGSYSVNLSAALGISSDELASGSKDGSYKVSVAATDNVGKTSTASKELTFTLDSTKPKIKVYVLQRHSVNDDVWEDVPAEEVDSASNTYFINDVLYDRVRFKVNVVEANLIDTDPVVCKNADTDAALGAFTFDTDAYYYEVPSSSLTTAEARALKAVITDKAGNENESSNQILLPKLQLVDADIKVELLEIWCDGEKLADITSLADLKVDFNKKYTIKVIAKSGFKITELELRQGTDTYSAIAAADIGDIADTTGIHTTNTNEFVLPSSTNNEKFANLKIYVRNSNGAFKEVTIGDLLYDSTDPIVKNTDTTVDYSKWYQDYTLSYEIKSGESAVESNLESAKYTVDATETSLTPSGIIQTGSINIPESASIAGTKVVFAAQDKATNSMKSPGNIFNIKVDKTAPSVAAIKINGEDVTESTVLAGTPSISSTVTDNLTIKDYVVTVQYNDENYAVYPVSVEKDATQESINYTLQQILGSKALKDGKYTVTISARDKSERNSNVASTSFIVDNTAPELSAEIISGVSAKQNGYYNTDVVVRLTCADNNFNADAMSVTNNGVPVDVSWNDNGATHYADITLSSEGLHSIAFSGSDKSGTAGASKSVSFIIDKTAPTVALLVNGGTLYNESMGALNMTGAANINVSVTDSNEDVGDLRVQVIKTIPDTATTTTEFMPTSNRVLTFSEEADYVINIYSVDLANNQGATRTISFRIDTTAPTLTITGANGGTSSSAVSVGFNITESFWQDASGTVNIYRKAGDGQEEALYKTLTVTPNQRAYTLTELLSDTGVYRFEFEARDKVGHTAKTEQSITVDRNKPDIRLTGVSNYDVTDGIVSVAVTVSDEFYQSKTVSATGTVLRADGTRSVVSFSPYSAAGNPTSIEQTFSEDGIYDISISSRDIAGNEAISKVHFTIDTTAPVIKDLSEYDGKTFNSIDLDLDLDELVSDLTVCDVRMYLNGSEYDGVSDIEDGSYTLLITAEDELGHKSEKSATFVLDTKAPVFIVTGVEDGDVKEENYDIEISLQLDEDKLTSVKLNDKDVLLSNNNTTATLKVTDRGVYELYMAAVDPAGNEAEQTISFVYGDEEMAAAAAVDGEVSKSDSTSVRWWLWIIAAAVVLGGGGFLFVFLKRRKSE